MEGGKHIELSLGQFEQGVTAAHLAGTGVHHEVANLHHLGDRPGRAPQQRPQPCQQLFERKRLDQVVIGTRIEPGHPVADLGAGGENQNRCGVAPSPNPTARFETVHDRHHYIEDDGFDVFVENDRQCLGPVPSGHDFITFEGQRPLDGASYRAVVFNHEHSLLPLLRHHCSLIAKTDLAGAHENRMRAPGDTAAVTSAL